MEVFLSLAGMLRQTIQLLLLLSFQELRHGITELLFELLPLPAWRVFGLLRKRKDRLQFRRSLVPFADVYSDVGCLIKHVRFASQRPLRGILSKDQSCFVSGDRSVHTHLAESRVYFLLPNIALGGIHQSRQSPQSTAIESPF